MVNEEKEMSWIKEHIDIMHDDMLSSDARRWFEMMENDFLTFVRLGLYGFVLKLGTKGQRALPEDVVSSFIKELQYKICLSVAGDVRIKGLPLFSIVGIDVIGEEVLKSDEAYRLHPGAQV